jgi:hypothetical protein
MPAGACRLYEQDKDLRNSHFIPAAFYKTARKSDPTGNTTDMFMATDMYGSKPVAQATKLSFSKR